MRIELDVFSGRPNPWWLLAREDVSNLELILMRLPHHGTAFPTLHVMGYRGITLMNEDPSGPWTDIIVYHEQITMRTRTGVDYLMDGDRSIENMLLETAKERVPGVLLERILAEPEGL